MKELLIVLLVFGSAVSSYAQEHFRNFRDPSVNGISFSSDSSPTIVCNYLGYSKAVSTSLESRLAIAVKVNEKGIIGSDFATMNDLVSVFTRITCKEPMNSENTVLQIPTLIKNPGHPSLKTLISRQSSENGVCKLLGFQRAAGGTLGKIIYPLDGLPIINEEGKVIGENFSSGSIIRKIICL